MASRLNALHTLPAPLAPASGFLARGKSLVQFYKTGITNVWKNRQRVKDLRAAYGCRSSFELAQSIVENAHLASIEHNVLKTKHEKRVAVSRDELLTFLRTERDVRKLPLFVVVFAICFELTPIVLWKFPKIAPSTCWSESVLKNIQTKYSGSLNTLHSHGEKLNGTESAILVPTPALRSLANTLNFGFHYRFMPRALLVQRTLQHLVQIRADDTLLRQNEDSLELLEHVELLDALKARALPLDGGLKALRGWLHSFVEPMDAGFFFLRHQNLGIKDRSS